MHPFNFRTYEGDNSLESSLLIATRVHGGNIYSSHHDRPFCRLVDEAVSASVVPGYFPHDLAGLSARRFSLFTLNAPSW